MAAQANKKRLKFLKYEGQICRNSRPTLRELGPKILDGFTFDTTAFLRASQF